MKGTSRQPAFVRSVLFEMALEQKAQGRRIAELREAKRWTQPIAADKAGVALRTYQDWEAGASRPRWPNLERLAHVFSVSVEALIGNEPLPDTRGGATPDLLGQISGNGDEPPAWAQELSDKLDHIILRIDVLYELAHGEQAPRTAARRTGRGRKAA